MGQLALTGWGAGALAQSEGFAPYLEREIARAHGRAPVEVRVAYRRYTTLKSTARIAADGKLVVTLCEDLRQRPQQAQAAIAHVLAARVLSRKAPSWAQAAYASWLRDPSTRELSLEVRQARARRRTVEPAGRFHDLVPLLDSVARDHFQGSLGVPPVAWTRAQGRSVLASFDEAHQVITVSRLLDQPRVKRETLRYLLYHEMLHFEDFCAERADPAAAGRLRGGRRRLHPPSFKERLHRFPGWKAAEADLARGFRRRRVL